MSWITDLWQILETVASLTKDSASTTEEIKELRKDLNTLTLIVRDLKASLEKSEETTRLTLDNYETQITHAKESIAAKFDVIIVRLDAKIADFERTLSSAEPSPHNRKQLKTGRKT